MKRFVTIVAVAALVAGCSKQGTSSTASGQASAAAAMATAAAAYASAAAAGASAAAAGASAAAAQASGEAQLVASAAPAAAASGSVAAIVLPVYPGANREADKSLSMSSNGSEVKVDMYLTKDDSPTVVAWYKAHLPSNWTNFTIASGPKTVGTFSSPESGNAGQSVIVTGGDTAGTRIQLTTKTGN